MNNEIFKKFSIQGTTGIDLTDHIVFDLGKGIGTKMRREGLIRISVGRDLSLSSKAFMDPLINGIRMTGLDIVDIGVVPPPVLFFSVLHLKLDGAVLITGSIDSQEFNTFKVFLGNNPIIGQELQEIKQVIKSGIFARGKGRLQNIDITTPYSSSIKERIKIKTPLKVVVDSGYGSGGVIALNLIKKLGCDVVEYKNTNHFSTSIDNNNLSYLTKKVKEEKANIGIAYGEDANKIGVVDEKGNFVFGDKLMILFSREILKKKPGANISFDVKCSQNLYHDIKKNGGMPMIFPSDDLLTKDKIEEKKVELAGMKNGHFFFSDGYFGFEDAIFASCRLLQIISNSNKTLSNLLADLPETIFTPEIQIDCPNTEKFEIIKHFITDLKRKYNVLDIEGAKVIINDGWGLLQASNTKPALLLNFEARTDEKLNEIKEIFYNKIKHYPSLKNLAPF